MKTFAQKVVKEAMEWESMIWREEGYQELRAILMFCGKMWNKTPLETFGALWPGDKVGLWAVEGSPGFVTRNSSQNLVFPLLMVAVYSLYLELMVRRKDVNFLKPQSSHVNSWHLNSGDKI